LEKTARSEASSEARQPEVPDLRQATSCSAGHGSVLQCCLPFTGVAQKERDLEAIARLKRQILG
jgi:hypothetical protein